MFTERHRQELETKGFTVVDNVLSEEFCNSCNSQYDEWLSKFTRKEEWPFTFNSLIQHYRSGHAEPSWRVRLAVKPIFAQLWGTEKLFSSIDAIAIGRPPEEGQEKFDDGESWLHVDQRPEQIGLHTIQGAVYLESAEADDWTFCVIENSHRLFDSFLQEHPSFKIPDPRYKSFRLREGDKEWFERHGGTLTRVPVPKGGMVLWDSRLVHANARPIKGRLHIDRWRRVVFVCMTPAIWARPQDIEKKVEAYNNLLLTVHRPSQMVLTFDSEPPEGRLRIPIVEEMPPSGKTEDAKELSGVIPYDFNNGEPNGPSWSPKWENDQIP